MKLIRLFLFTILILFSQRSFAAEGCAIGAQLYTQETTPIVGITIAADLKVYQQPGNNCFRGTPSTAKACFVCESGGRVVLVVGATPLVYIVTCGDRFFLDLGYPATRGTYYSSYVLECNLDDYSWGLSIAAAGLGLLVIRNRFKI